MGDDLWRHFEDMGNGQAQCKHCQKSYSFKTSVANLRNHLERNHEGALSSPSTSSATPSTPHQLFVTSTTLTTDDYLNYSSAIKALDTFSEQEHSDTDTQNNSQTANTESSDVEHFPKKVISVLDALADDDNHQSPPRVRTIRRRMKRPSLRGGGIHIDTDEDFGRLISKKMHLLPLALRCRLEVDILSLVNGALNSMEDM